MVQFIDLQRLRRKKCDRVGRLTFLSSILIPAVLTVLTAASAFGQKQICITFDELPAARSFDEVDRVGINRQILDALKKHGAKATGFVVGEQIEGAFDILGEWLNEGHRLGNQTFSGQDYNELSPEQFIGDIRRGADALEPMLAGFGQKKRYFRFPYLHYGDTPQRRKAVGPFLKDRKYVVAPATVLPEDYLFNLNLLKLGHQPDSAKFNQLMNDYLNHVLDELERVEGLGKNMVGRPVRQILLLRANQLNAAFLDNLLQALEELGYKFIPLDEALKDEVYSKPEGYYGLKGLGYLDMIQQSDPDLVPAE
jgi:peptidoglycan/xylan/chitin deacetylase (PgdA/CDA1 family)